MRSKRFFLAILVFIMLHTAAADDDDFGMCKIMNCGKGTCNNKSSSELIDLVPACECDPGWKQPSIAGVSLSFLPCVIPNCTFEADCGGKAPSSAPSPANPPSSSSSVDLLNACKLGIPVCGEGTCVFESMFSYRCNCNEGYENLLNMTAGPCFRQCSIGADCSQLGFSVGGKGSRAAAPQSPTAAPQSSKGFMEDIPYLISIAIALTIRFSPFLLE